MNLSVMSCRVTQDRWVMVKNSDKTWFTEGENSNPLQYSCHENTMNSMKRQKDITPEDEPPRLIGVQYATREEWRNSSRRNGEVGLKQKPHPVLDDSGGESKVRCCKEQYCIDTWNIRSMNQGKLNMVKQETARVNIEILEISELKWMGIGKFNSDVQYIYYCG